MDNLESAAAQLREGLVNLKQSETWAQIVAPRDGVFARFRPIFQPNHIGALTEEELRPFFYFEKNHHWTGLFRQVNRLCSDMPHLRQILAVLVDESRPIDARLDECGGAITGLGKGIMTAILTVADPEKYGVWNNVSEEGLFKVCLWPEFPRGTSLGTKYLQINKTLSALRDSLAVDFWTLDAIWWQIGRGDDTPVSVIAIAVKQGVASASGVLRFGLERHLQDFLYDNWDNLDLGREWAIYSEPGAPDAGYEYACAVGRIDILARHRTLKGSAQRSRYSINRNHWRILDIFRWSAEQELISGSVYHALLSVKPLRAGETQAREFDPVGPVSEEVIEATLPFVSPHVAVMIQLQRLTGMRSGEMCLL